MALEPGVFLDFSSTIAIDPVTDRLYLNHRVNVTILKSAEEGNEVLEKEVLPVPEGSTKPLEESSSIAIDSVHKKMYIGDKSRPSEPGFSVVRVFELAAPHNEVGQIDGSTIPGREEFLGPGGDLPIDIDDLLGHVFVDDIGAEKVYEFEENGTYMATIEHSFARPPQGDIAVDDGKFSPHPQKEGWLFVPSVPGPTNGHVYAFEPVEEGPPVVEEASVSGITDTEAVLQARINPEGAEATYRLEYVTRQQFEEEEGKSFLDANATVAGEGTLPKGAEGVSVSAAGLELDPDTAYRFRAFAENNKGEDEEERVFKTFEKPVPPPVCENDALRTGVSSLLPDCRAYELVTPPDTNGRPPFGGFSGIFFPSPFASPDGNRASFLIPGGVIPGNEGAGSFNGDLYRSTRGSEGWETESVGPNGEEAINPFPGSPSPDQTYSLWQSKTPATFIHYPNGQSRLVGQGSLGEDPGVSAKLITEDAGHIVFEGTVPLEPNAAPAGTKTIYDRSAEGPTHVVSLLPEDEPQKAGEGAFFLGASEEGEGSAFEIGGTIYLRLHNEETFEVAGSGSTFAGVAAGGTRVFYLNGGDLFAFDAEEEKLIPFSTSGDVTPVNIASGGTRAYFVSPTVLTTEPNPNGEKAKKSAENLYLSEEGAISFIGIVTERDVKGENRSDGLVGGLGLWQESLAKQGPARDPSRTTPSGSTLLFESRADLTSFESEGFAQIYRYDATEGRLTCLSCGSIGTPPTADASLQTIARSLADAGAGGAHMRIPNQSPSGQRAFFQTAEPLVVGDTDELLDVYEWEQEGVGSCEKPGGCTYLISGGHSAAPNYLWAMSASGDDVFFRTSDLLLPRDAESTFSIYDARVRGGFPEPEPEIPCEGESCHSVSPPPNLPQNTTSTVGPDGNVLPPKACLKGKHKAKRRGKTVCVKNHRKHHKHHGHRRAGSAKKGGSK
ncbi:MAG TPA: hypothetical protein VFJ65_06170 [Solirubrobacterales bacterium]|nr:hypothetical protein [Solirubrobacterales bacterium]